MIRDRLSDLWCEARDMATSLFTVLVLAAGIIGFVSLWQSCTTGRAPLQMLRERDGN